MDKLLEQAPKIIAESSKSPLGIVSLSILALSVIGFFFFRESSESTRVAMFVLMFLGYGLLCLSLLRKGRSSFQTIPASAAEVSGEQAVATTTGSEQLEIPRRTSRRFLRIIASFWFVMSGILFVLITLQTLFGRYGNSSEIVWMWLAPALLPSLSVVVAALVFIPEFNERIISRKTKTMVFIASALYLIFLLLTLLVQPFLMASPERVLAMSSLIASPFQGAVVIMLVVWLLSGTQVAPNTSLQATPKNGAPEL